MTKAVPRVLAQTNAHLQYAALPWRVRAGKLEVLLITTLNTQRWIVPKGWPIDGLPPHACAAFEALEEAGVSGEIAQAPLGSFSYGKQRRNGEIVRCTVAVFTLKVTRERKNWAESSVRKLRWCPPEEAALTVRELGLRRLLAEFAKRYELA
ncbi:MAG: NUDIX hydrolase [Proteobacteria bacterium]|nr:NUDIX hydrolase [Pseudomonadota bacterium]